MIKTIYARGKRIFALLLTVLLCLLTATQVFAAYPTTRPGFVDADYVPNTEFHTGDKINIKLTVPQDFTDDVANAVSSMFFGFEFYYTTGFFSCLNYDWADPIKSADLGMWTSINFSENRHHTDDVNRDGFSLIYGGSYDWYDDGRYGADLFVAQLEALKDGTFGEAEFIKIVPEIITTIEIESASTPSTEGFTVFADSTLDPREVTYSADFNVDVKVKAAPAAGFTSMEANLEYDPALVELGAEFLPYDNSGVTVSAVSDAANQLKISKTSADSTETTATADGTVIVSIPFKSKTTAGSAEFKIVAPVNVDSEDNATPVGETLTIEIKAPSVNVPTVADYAAVPGGHKLLKYTVPELPASGNGYEYDGKTMYYAPHLSDDGAYVFLTLISAEAAAVTADKIAESATAIAALANDGDISGNGELRVMDAQIVYNIVNDKYEDVSAFSVKQWLEADVDGDGAITADDAASIQYRLHYGVWDFNAAA
jgi:hypothetical protein